MLKLQKLLQNATPIFLSRLNQLKVLLIVIGSIDYITAEAVKPFFDIL